MAQYKSKVISGFIWSAGEKFASTAIRIVASVFVLRFISPEQFGVVELLAVFSFMAYTIIDSGFSQALIRKRDAGEKDYNSIFYLNVGIALILYGLLVGLSFPLAWFFHVPALPRLAPVLFLTLPLSALGIIQTTLLSRRMDFRTLSKVSLTASVCSSVTLAVLAALGYGAWALVWATVTNEVVKTGYLWISSRWRPGWVFSTESVRELYSFGSRLFLTGIITQAFNRVSTVIIGRVYNPAQVGLYNQSLKFKDSIATALSQSLYNVSYPALASFQDDGQKLRHATRQVVQVLSFILFPVMAGLILVAPEGFALAGGDKWIPAVPYFRIFCLSAFFTPLSNASMNILRAKGLGNTILKAELVKKTFAAAAIALAAFFNVLALAAAYTVWMGFEMCVNAYYSRKCGGYAYRMQAADTLPYIAITAGMIAAVAGAVWVAYMMMPGFFTAGTTASTATVFVVKIITGIATYVLLAYILKPAAWKESTDIVGRIFRRKP